MFELEDLFDLTLDGAFANKEEFLSFANDASPEEILSILQPGAFSSKEELESMIVKKKESTDTVSQLGGGSSVSQETPEQAPGQQIPIEQQVTGVEIPAVQTTEVVSEEVTPQAITDETVMDSQDDGGTLRGRAFDSFELVEPTKVEEVATIEDNVLAELGIDQLDYNAWKKGWLGEENLRPESSSYRFFKELLLNDEGTAFERQETVNKRIGQYLASKLDQDLEELNAVDDQAMRQILQQQLQEKRKKIIDLLPAYKKETVTDEREDRRKLLERLNNSGVVGTLGYEGWEAAKASANAFANFAMGYAGAFTQMLDTGLASAGFDKKGILAGVTDMMLDSAQAWDLDMGETKRPIFISGKKVIHNGKTYIVEDGVIYDDNTHIRVDDIISSQDAKDILSKADNIKVTETFFDAGSGLTGTVRQLSNLYALIRSGQGIQRLTGLGPKAGMGIASFGSTVAQNIQDVKDDLMAEGLSEDEATWRSGLYGSLISSLDGTFSAIAGGNEKLLPGREAIRQQLLDLIKTKASQYTREQFKQKAWDLLKENAKELFIEEIPVLISERGVNNLINWSSGVNARQGIESLQAKDFYETTFLTLGSTTALGSTRLLSNNDRNDALRSLANTSVDFELTARKMVAEGMLTEAEANTVVQEINNFRLAENKTAGAIKGTQNMLDASELIEEKDKLVQQRENMDPSLRGPIDEKIKDLDDRIKGIQEKDVAETEQAIRQEQTRVTIDEARQSLKEENEARSKAGMPVILESRKNIEQERQRLIQQKEEDYRKSYRVEVSDQEVYDALKAEGIDNPTIQQLVAKSNQIKKQKQDAIQKQKAGAVPDAQRAEGVQEMETEVRQPAVQEEEKVDKNYSTTTIAIRTRPKSADEDVQIVTGLEAQLADASIEKITNDGIKKGQTTQEILDRILPRFGFNDAEINGIRSFVDGKRSGETTTDFATYRKGRPAVEQEAAPAIQETQEVISTEQLSTPETFTHQTKSEDAIVNWANSGQVIGRNEDINEFDSRVAKTIPEKGQKVGMNRQSPNFQKGGLYSNKINEGVKFVVVNKNEQNFIPSDRFMNVESFDQSRGISTLRPGARDISNFDLYSVNEDGTLTKRSWDEFKTQDKQQPMGEQEAAPAVEQEQVEYTLPEKNPLKDFEIINNIGNRAGLEIDENGNGRFYVRNKVTGKVVGVKNKSEAEDARRQLDGDYGEGDLVDVQAEAPVVEKPQVEAKPIVKSQVIPSPKGKPSNTQVNIAEDGTLVSVTNVKTGEEVSTKTKKIAEQSFLTTGIDVNANPRIDDNPSIAAEEYTDVVIQDGTNIKEIAEVIQQVQTQAETETVEDPLAMELEGRKFTPESWVRLTGFQPKEMPRGFSRTWLSKDGESLEDLDNREDVIDFINTNPTASILKQGDVETKEKVNKLKKKFEELTGVKATESNLNTVRQIDPDRVPLEVIKPKVEAEKEMLTEDERIRREQETAEARAKAKEAAESMMSKEAKQLKTEMEEEKMFFDPSIKQVVDRSYELGVSNTDTNRILEDLGYTNEEIVEFRKKEEKLYVPVKTKLGRYIPGVDKVLDNLNRFQKKIRSARRYLPKNVFFAKEKADANIATEISVAERTAKRFNKMMKGQPESVYEEVNKFLKGEEYNLPLKIAEAALEMRTHIDQLSQMLIDNGVVKGESAVNVAENIGSYLNRSYRVFNDADYSETVSDQLINEAEQYIKNSYYTNDSKFELAQQEAEEKGLSVEEWIDKKASLEVSDILNKKEANEYVRQATLGAKKLETLTQRKEIPGVIRALMGEYNDPAYNYAVSIANITNMVENQKFLNSMLDIGKGVFLFGENDVDRPKDYVKISAEGNQSLQPLDGMYAPKEIVQQLQQSPTMNIDKNSDIGKGYLAWLTMVGAVKKTKTIYSFATHMKNVLGNAFMMAQNGYVNPKDYNKAFQLLRNEFKGQPDEVISKRLDEYKRLGIINQSVQLNEIKDLLSGNESYDVKVEKRIQNQSDNKFNLFVRKGVKAVKNVDQFLQNMYQAEDDLFKIVSFENEKRKYAEILYDQDYESLSDDQRQKVDDKVSNIVKDILPNYSRLGGLAKALKIIPVRGTFISFQLEAYRTAANTLKLAVNETLSDNPRMRTKGIQRLISLSAFQGLKVFAYQQLAKTLIGGLDGGEEEDEEKDSTLSSIKDFFIAPGENAVDAVRPFIPSYRQNSDLSIFDAGDGKFTYIDLSASDPYGGMHKLFNAISRSKGLGEAITEGGLEAVSPLGLDIFAKAALDLANFDGDKWNPKDPYGNDLFDASMSTEEKALRLASRIWDTFEPGTITTIRKEQKAYDKEGIEGLKKETLGQLLGYKPYEVDVAKQLSFRMKDTKKDRDDVRKITSRAKYKIKETGNTDGLFKAYAETDRKMRPVYEEAHKNAQAAMRMGVPLYQVKNTLKQQRFNSEDISFILFYPDLEAALDRYKGMAEDN